MIVVNCVFVVYVPLKPKDDVPPRGMGFDNCNTLLLHLPKLVGRKICDEELL